jgi:hypothetical protein
MSDFPIGLLGVSGARLEAEERLRQEKARGVGRDHGSAGSPKQMVILMGRVNYEKSV